MDLKTINNFVLTISEKYALNRLDVIRCAPKKIKRKILYSKIPRDVADCPYEKVDDVAVGKRLDSQLVPLSHADIEYCRVNRIPYQLPDNLTCTDTDYTAEILSYLSDSD